MNPTGTGASANTFDSSLSDHQGQGLDDGYPSGEKPREKSSPRMLTPHQEAEVDGMEVDNSGDEDASMEDRRRPPKRDRESDPEMQDAHSEPKFKRQRTSVETPPAPSETGGHADSSSSSSSSSTSGAMTSMFKAFACRTGAPRSRMALKDEEVLRLLKEIGIIDMKQAALVLFDPPADEWPTGFSLLEIASLSPVMEETLIECGVHVLWTGQMPNWAGEMLALVTPESDRERLSLRLIQVNDSESRNLKAGPVGAPDAQVQRNPPLAVDSDDDDDDDDDDDSWEDDSDDSACPSYRKHTTALMIAAALNDDELVRTLLANGADPNRRDRNDRTALMVAAGRGHLRIVRSLIHDSRTQVNLTTTDGWNALCEAAAEGHRKVASMLLSFGGAMLPLQVSPDTYLHPMLIAAKYGHHAVCELFVSRGLDIDITNQDGWTALWFAANSDQLECCEHLLDASANINHIRNDGASLLEYAVSTDKLALFELLVKRGAAITTEQGRKPLLNLSVKLRQKEMVRRLIELNVDINATDRKKQTALTVACNNNATEFAELLIKAGAHPDIDDAIGWNSLVYAAGHGNIKLLELLIEHGAKLDSKGDFGYLALHQATHHARLDAMKLLLSRAAPTIAIKRSRSHVSSATPLILLPMISKAYHEDLQRAWDAIYLLVQHGAPLDAVDEYGRDLLTMAVIEGIHELIPLLFNAGMTVGQTTRRGLNALQLAAQRVDDALAEAPVPVSGHGARAVASLWLIVEIAKRQPNWSTLGTAAVMGAWHPITREIIWQMPLASDLPVDNSIILFPYALSFPRAQVLIQGVRLDAGNDWDRVRFEIGLCLAGASVPAINAYCAHMEAFPAMKLRLFGPGATAKIRPLHWTAFFCGMTANMGKMIMDGHEIEDAYKDLGEGKGRDWLMRAARSSISSASEFAVLNEQDLGTRAFATLFDDCLQATLSAQSAQALDLHLLPGPGAIAETLMDNGVYAALADEIEAAWRTAWSEAIEAAPAATSSSSSSASSGEFSSGTEASAMLGAEAGNPAIRRDKLLSEQQSSALLSAFRKALSKNVDSARLLKLPDASAEVAGLYADLMHRQLHMIAQFIRGESEVEPAPVAAPAPAPAPAPDYQPELWDSVMSEDWFWNEDWS